MISWEARSRRPWRHYKRDDVATTSLPDPRVDSGHLKLFNRDVRRMDVTIARRELAVLLDEWPAITSRRPRLLWADPAIDVVAWATERARLLRQRIAICERRARIA